ncbi:hypothetical protein MLD38_021972 [Melastoma candidum]|uniref:Uncharacterized protein n=1 Tax=Melastoma candidum TaxID=119954 RepID=A0ACB9QIQ1_9MYRT|nr:hypothetical protein MLD38_021972 [Melastoma candidum]
MSPERSSATLAASAFETTVSYPLAGSLVRLECFNRTSGAFMYAAEAKTDANGVYLLAVEGDHEEEICEVHAVNSSDPKCSSLVPDAIKNARISLTKNNGVTESTRYANHLFFATEKSLENCPKILFEMGILPPGTDGFHY